MARLTRLCINDYCSDIMAELSNYYTKSEVNELIDSIENMHIEVVSELPQTGDTNIIYLVPKEGEEPNVYDEYIYVRNSWEKIGDTDIDLSNYVTTGDLQTALSGKQNTLTAGNNIQISGDTISATDTTYNDATQTTSGLMSAADKTKLDELETLKYTKDYDTDTTTHGVVQNGVENNSAGDYALAEGKSTTASGEAAHTEGRWTTASGVGAHAEGQGTTASELNAHAEGQATQAVSARAHAEGYSTKAEGEASHAEGSGTETSANYAHAEGYGTKATNANSHAEGNKTTSSGENSHAEGVETTASGANSHAEGDTTIASGDDAHAEGVGTVASGRFSHAQNDTTIAAGDRQTALGRYNIADEDGDYAVIVGNGTDTNRSNALTVDWDGNVVMGTDLKTTTIADIITVNSSNATITVAEFARWGKVAQLHIAWTNKSAISVPANGNIGNVTIGTLVAGKRPIYSHAAWSHGDNAGAAWYNFNAAGAIGLGACEGTGAARTIAANTRFDLYTTFILA